MDTKIKAEVESCARKAFEQGTPLHRLSEIDASLSEDDLALVRARVLELKTGRSLSSVYEPRALSFTSLVGRNIENPVGAVTIPVGVVGPILMDGSYARGEVFLPLATTEGALVASVNRGAAATRASGGVRARVLKDEMTRAPVFKTDSVSAALRLKSWVEENFDSLADAAAETTSHGKLVSAATFVVGCTVFVRLSYSTGEAMGMNMATIASERVASLIERNTGARLVALSGNVCSDKKAAHINSLLGRGKTVVAEALLTRDVLSSVLKASAAKIVEVNVLKNMVGSSVAGSFS
ncbi:MAG: 3-hydroxy-3-methylglutaryl-CoA reductase, partial [Thermoprotei archaeon]